MNLNANYVAIDEGLGGMGEPAETLAETVDEHREILAMSGYEFTGGVALVTDETLLGTGAMQVWSQIQDGRWIWVNTEGEVVTRKSPFEDE